MLNKFHTIKELKDIGLKMFGSCISPDTKIGEKYLQPKVINMWDSMDYSEFYTYFDEKKIEFVVRICVKIDEKTIKCKNLRKDLANLRELEELEKKVEDKGR